ncbi:MAG: SatD family protein [Cytophagales bacterium]|nr:SatD family protein [Cytophagales bacterium]
MKTFKREVKKVNRWLNDRLLSPFTITSGDEFQGVVKDLVDE